MKDLANLGVSPDTVGLLEGISTTRAIRRYRDEPIPDHVLRDILFAATRAPSGSNRQPFRFVVLTDSERATSAKALIQAGARRIWGTKRLHAIWKRRATWSAIPSMNTSTCCRTRMMR